MPRRRRDEEDDDEEEDEEDDDDDGDDGLSGAVVVGGALLLGYLLGKALSGGPSRTVRCSNCQNLFATRVPQGANHVQTVCPYCSQSTIAYVQP
jgi:hypothetical protein